MGREEGGSQSFPSVLHHQIDQHHEIWCENNLSAYLCLKKAPRSIQEEQFGTTQPIDVGVTTNYHSFVRIACFGTSLRRISYLRDRNNPRHHRESRKQVSVWDPPRPTPILSPATPKLSHGQEVWKIKSLEVNEYFQYHYSFQLVFFLMTRSCCL